MLGHLNIKPKKESFPAYHVAAFGDSTQFLGGFFVGLSRVGSMLRDIGFPHTVLATLPLQKKTY